VSSPLSFPGVVVRVDGPDYGATYSKHGRSVDLDYGLEWFLARHVLSNAAGSPDRALAPLQYRLDAIGD
jgi:hypothetical protein